MRLSTIALAGISFASLAVATPAAATSDVAVDTSACRQQELTDGDAIGCKFSGNINMNTGGNSSYLLAQQAYNDFTSPDITLTPLADLDPGHLSGGGITITLNADQNGGTFTLAPGVTLDFFAVKTGNNFILYQYTGSNTFSTAGLAQGQNPGNPGLSHILFFGSGGPVPEPATWAMMLLGIGMIGAGMRHRRKNQVVPAVLA